MMQAIQFITLNPGHFHAALVQKEMYDQVASTVHVYAPLGADLAGHLSRIAGFNGRSQQPTQWELEVHACENYLQRFSQERPGNVVVLAGRNASKIDAILAALDAGMNVLADKPWILTPNDLPKLRQALEFADERRLIAYDMMTERYEITSILQRAFVHDSDTFGTILPGSPDEPGVFMESMHYLKKVVAGVPLRRPGWFFDVHEQGEALSDVGTHLVDLVPWILFPEQALEAEKDLCVLAAKRWPTIVPKSAFQQITGESDFPASLAGSLDGEDLPYYCNSLVNYTVRGTHVKLNVLWNFEAAPGAGDTHLAVFRGSRARVEVRQGREEKYLPELYIIPNKMMDYPLVRRAVDRRVEALRTAFPGLGVIDLGMHLRIAIPQGYRVGHEAHFTQVTMQFLRYLLGQDAVPAWEKPNMIAKYFTTTRGVELSRQTT
jgi:predicted dehydrogenase